MLQGIKRVPSSPRYPTALFSLYLYGCVPVEQQPSQSNCRPADGEVKCVWSFVTDSLITYQVFEEEEKIVHRRPLFF